MSGRNASSPRGGLGGTKDVDKLHSVTNGTIVKYDEGTQAAFVGGVTGELLIKIAPASGARLTSAAGSDLPGLLQVSRSDRAQ